MSKVSNDNIEQHMKQGFHQMSQGDAEQLWNQPVQRAKGNEWYLDGISEAKKRWSTKTIGSISAIAAAVVLCTAVYLYRTFAVEATVCLKVNPCVEFQTNVRNQVLSVKGCNADGKKVIEGMDLRHTDINVAVNAVLGSMMRHGYINDNQKMVSVSVDGRNEKHAETLSLELQEQVDKEVEECLEHQTEDILEQNEAEDEIEDKGSSVQGEEEEKSDMTDMPDTMEAVDEDDDKDVDTEKDWDVDKDTDKQSDAEESEEIEDNEAEDEE